MYIPLLYILQDSDKFSAVVADFNDKMEKRGVGRISDVGLYTAASGNNASIIHVAGPYSLCFQTTTT